MSIIISQEKQDSIIKEYIDGKSIREIASKYACQKTVSKVIDKYGVRRAYTGWTRYSVDDTFFSTIDTEEKAYWLGFLYADGCVTKNRVSLSLAEKDRLHVEMFKNTIKYTGPITERKIMPSVIKGKKINASRQIVVNISRNKIAHDLILLGCVPAKSLILRFPTVEQVPVHLVAHFIRGNLDGDGSVSSSIRGKRKRYLATFLGTDLFLGGVRDYLMSRGLRKVKIRKDGNIYRLAIQGHRQVCLLKHILYKEASVFLQRKRKVFEECALMELSKQGFPKTFIFKDPLGNEVEIHNMLKFCRENGMNAGCMYRVIAGKKNHYKNYRFVRHSNDSYENALEAR
jgi:hypothetical protein